MPNFFTVKMEDYVEAVAQVDKNETKIKRVSMFINIFLTIGMLINILDNDLLRDIINGEYKFQRSTTISAINIAYSFIILVVSNVYYFVQ